MKAGKTNRMACLTWATAACDRNNSATAVALQKATSVTVAEQAQAICSLLRIALFRIALSWRRRVQRRQRRQQFTRRGQILATKRAATCSAWPRQRASIDW